MTVIEAFLCLSISRLQRLNAFIEILSWAGGPGYYISRLWRFRGGLLTTNRITRERTLFTFGCSTNIKMAFSIRRSPKPTIPQKEAVETVCQYLCFNNSLLSSVDFCG